MSNYDYNAIYNEYMQEANRYADHFGIDPNTQHNGDWDAFRHSYTSGAMTHDYNEAIAHAAGELNELRGDILHNQPPEEKIWIAGIMKLEGGLVPALLLKMR